MRIAIITNTYPPRLGGLEAHVENLAQGLADLGHDVWVLTIGRTRGRRLDGAVRVLTGRSHLPIADVITVPSLGTTREISRFLASQRIDVVSTHTRFFPMSLVGQRAAHHAGIPVIHTEHGSGFVSNPNPVIAAGARAVDLVMGRAVLRGADQVLAISEAAAAFVERLSGVEATVFYNAIPPVAPRPAATDRPEHLVFVGRVVAGKGWEQFLTTIASLRAEGLAVDGELLGAGAQLDDARAMCHDLGLDDSVRIPGRVPPAEVRDSLAGATLINPTVLSEGFQTTLLEAISEGARVVTYEVPGARLLASQGAPVIVCAERSGAALVDATRSMLASPPPAAAPEVLQAWTWPVRAREYAAIAEQVLGRR